MVADLTTAGETLVIAKRQRRPGNACFATPTNRTPAVPSPSGENRILVLNYAHRSGGTVGLPNADKSTLLKALTNANQRSRISVHDANPNLGVLKFTDRNCHCRYSRAHRGRL